jgi:hypothetical protein
MILIPGIEALGQPRLGSIYDEVGTDVAGYAEGGPYHCEDCVHKTASDEPFCIHPKVLGDPEMQSRLVMIDNRPTVKINLEHGCCAYVRPPAGHVEEAEHEDKDNGGHE